MKNATTIQKTLEEYRGILKEYEENPEETQELYIYQGWVEALEFVLADPVVDPDLKKAFDRVADEIAFQDYWHGTNGLFSYADDIEEGLVEDEMGEELEGWHATIHYGVQSDVEDTTSRIRVGITKADFELWLKEPAGNTPEWREIY